MEHKPLLSTLVCDEHRKQTPKVHLNSFPFFSNLFQFCCRLKKDYISVWRGNSHVLPISPVNGINSKL